MISSALTNIYMQKNTTWMYLTPVRLYFREENDSQCTSSKLQLTYT